MAFLTIFYLINLEVCWKHRPDTVVYYDLAHVQTIRARYIHFSPAAWHGDISMRVELYGCRGTNGLLSPNLLYTQFLSVLQGQLRHL